MTYTKPLLIAGIGLPVLGGCGYACYAFMQPTNLKEDLMKQNFTPLSKDKQEDKEDWIKLIKQYWKDKSTPKMADLKIELSETPKPQTEPTEEQITKFQKACNDLFEKKKKDSDYQNAFNLAKTWCIKNSEKIANKSTT